MKPVNAMGLVISAFNWWITARKERLLVADPGEVAAVVVVPDSFDFVLKIPAAHQGESLIAVDDLTTGLQDAKTGRVVAWPFTYSRSLNGSLKARWMPPIAFTMFCNPGKFTSTK